MKFFHSIRSRSSKLKAKKATLYCGDVDSDYQRDSDQLYRYMTPPPVDCISRLPEPVIERIFSLICPHASDDTYEDCERSALPDTCMLCDLRDLAHCVAVSKKWRKTATRVLYHSIRIDAVHYCSREMLLAEKRKRSRFDRNGEPEDTPAQRLRLLCRTLRENDSHIGQLVRLLKLTYMTRETCKADLARTVAVLPNLLYVDLPEGFFTDDHSCLTLKQEVQVRCPDIRKMSFHAGSERSFDQFSHGHTWRNLEVLEISGLRVDPTMVRNALGMLPHLRALKITNVKTLGDELFQEDFASYSFPSLKELILESTPGITVSGLMEYLLSPLTHSTLTTLSLKTTGVHPSNLHQILAAAPSLVNLSIEEVVDSSFPSSSSIQLLSSMTLKTLHYEITATESNPSWSSLSIGYYNYLSSSLLAGGLPNLISLYVRDPDFPERLVDLAPPAPAFVADEGSSRRFSSNNPFASMVPRGLDHELEIYSKGLDELEWNFATLQPANEPGRRGSLSAQRPISSYGLDSGSMGGSWARGKDARRSIIVGNGFGGFLAIPADGDERPGSSRSARRASQIDMWR